MNLSNYNLDHSKSPSIKESMKSEPSKTIEITQASVDFVNFSIKNDYILTSIDNRIFKLTPNSINRIFLDAIVEEFNDVIGADNLLKKVCNISYLLSFKQL